MKKNILFIQNSFAPYRMYLFNRLLEYYNIDVLYLEKFDKTRNWNELKREIKYKYYVSKNYEQIIFEKKISISNLSNFNFNKYDEVVIITNFPNLIDISKIVFKLRKKYILWISVWKNYQVFDNNKFIKGLVNKLLNNWINLLVHYAKKCIGYCKSSCAIVNSKLCLYSSQYYPLEQEYGLISLEDVIMLSKEKFSDKLNLITISYLSPRKNIEFAILTINNFPDVNLHIVGSGNLEYEKYLKSIASNNIIFHGYKEGKEKEKLLRMADLFLFTTKKDSWGFVINEALYFGLPVISSDKAIGALDLIENKKNGFIYHNKTELNQILFDIINNKYNLYDMSINAKKSISDFNNDVITNFRKILG